MFKDFDEIYFYVHKASRTKYVPLISLTFIVITLIGFYLPPIED